MNWRPALDPPGFDRNGKPTGPTLDRCSYCGVGKGEEHKHSCYVHNKWGMQAAARVRGSKQTENLP